MLNPMVLPNMIVMIISHELDSHVDVFMLFTSALDRYDNVILYNRLK